MSDAKPEAEVQKHQPIFLLPGIILGLVGVLVAIHLAKELILNEDGQVSLLLWFGFIPLRFFRPDEFAGGILPLLWTPFTHALLHAGWEHLIINCAWLAIFGTPVARRYGGGRFLALFAICSAAGALGFMVLSSENSFILIGASGGIAGLTGAAIRFIFQPVEVARHPETGEVVVLGRRLASLAEVIKSPRPRIFALFWVGLNVLTPILPILTGMSGLQIAWQAHLGGFFAGLLLVPLCEFRKPETKE